MTDQELLQQAKDQVAGNCLNDDAFPCSTWDEVMSSSCISKRYVDELNKEAALLAIQSAREEAANEALKTLQSIQSDSSVVSIYIKASEAIKKLTAPGR